MREYDIESAVIADSRLRECIAAAEAVSFPCCDVTGPRDDVTGTVVDVVAGCACITTDVCRRAPSDEV